MKYCLACGGMHEGKFCPPDFFAIITCTCGNEILMPGDAIGLSLDGMCGSCEKTLRDTNPQIRRATLKDMSKHNPNYGKYCMNLRVLDLQKINSATKYPSIPTYHVLSNIGGLKEKVLVHFDQNDDLSASEKIDGANSRIILFPSGDYIIGSREDLLTSRFDLVYNQSLGIVDAVNKTAGNAIRLLGKRLEQTVYVFYGETYGGKKITQGSKNYSISGKTGFRLFDISIMAAKEFEELLDKPIENISLWRENGGQIFLHQTDVKEIADIVKCLMVPSIKVQIPPVSIEDTYKWLKGVSPSTTLASLDEADGKPEGVVIRTKSRSKIAKIRFDDYMRTLESVCRFYKKGIPCSLPENNQPKEICQTAPCKIRIELNKHNV